MRVKWTHALIESGPASTRYRLTRGGLRLTDNIFCDDLSSTYQTSRPGSPFDYEGIDFSFATLIRAILQSTDLRRAYFRRSNLQGTDWTEADLTDADFAEASAAGGHRHGGVRPALLDRRPRCTPGASARNATRSAGGS